MVVPSIVVGTAFSYLENYLLNLLQMSQHQISQEEEATTKIAAPRHDSFKNTSVHEINNIFVKHNETSNIFIK